MRKIGVVAALTAVLVLAGCGDDGGSEDASETEDTSANSDAGAESGNGDDEEDISAALLVAGDLPEGVEVEPMDISGFSGAVAGMTEMLEDVEYDPAECKENSADPLMHEGVEAAAMTAMAGSGANIEVLMNAVFAGASTDDVDALTDYYENCSEIAITGSIAGQQLDMVTKTTVTDAPDLDADAVLALEVAVESATAPAVPQRLVYAIEGDHGTYVAANAESSTFDVDALAATVLDRLQEL